MDEATGGGVEVWPDCVVPVNLFISLLTQWRVAAGWPTGLDYNVLYRKMDRMHLSEAEYDGLEDDIRVLESAALEQMRVK